METINSFQQFFRVQSPPPALFQPSRVRTLTPSKIKSCSQQRETPQSKDIQFGSMKEVKRKSYSFIRKPDTITPRIFVRFRPLNEQEYLISNTQSIQYQDENTVIVAKQPFKLDKVFTPNDSQEIVYERVAQQTLQDVVNGINGTIIAYGQTGSGKTHTMLGSLKDQGIIYRAICEILSSEQRVNISLFEVYKESINDLLNGLKDLKLKEDPIHGVYVERLSKVVVEDESQLKELIHFAEDNRHVAETKFNSSSSRSHLILTVQLNNGVKLNLVDLAGSEKVAKTGAKGETLEEAKKINSSLSCLGHVVQSLSQGLEHIPYRDSKLTRILQDSLQGNCRTSLIVTCSPHSMSLDETISSLKFAQRAKLMKPQFKASEKKSYKDLEAEIVALKGELLTTKFSLVQSQGHSQQTQDNLEEHSTKHSSSPSGWRSPQTIKQEYYHETPPDTESNTSTQRLVNMMQADCSLEQQANDVQRYMSYFLTNFSIFIREFACHSQAKHLTQQLMELNQSFQSLSKMVKQEEQKFQSQQRCLNEYKKSTASITGMLSAASNNLCFDSKLSNNMCFDSKLSNNQCFDSKTGSLVLQENKTNVRVDRILSQANISDYKSMKTETKQEQPKQIVLRTEEADQVCVPHSTPIQKHREYENDDPDKRSNTQRQNKRGASQKYLKTSEIRMQGLLNKLKKI